MPQLFVGLILIGFACSTLQTDVCIKRDTLDIPSDHIFHKKTKPLILGHRGQPRKFQENSIEGIKSVADLGADGFETDIYLTDYNQLVLFHDDNAKALTGVDKIIWQMTPQEIGNLSYQKTLTYGSQNLKYTFSKERKVGLLEDLLKAVKDTDMLMYLEMKPSKLDSVNLTKSMETGKAVAKLVTRLGLQKKAFLVSFDFMKSLAAKRENPDLVVGSFYSTSYWNKDTAWYSSVKKHLKTLPGLSTCLDALPSNRSLMDFLFEKGSVFKSINASFVDMDYKIYGNKSINKDAVKTLRDNYNKKLSFGAWTIYSMSMSNAQIEASEDKVQALIDKGAERLITDDIARLRKKLKRNIGEQLCSSILLTLISFAVSVSF